MIVLVVLCLVSGAFSSLLCPRKFDPSRTLHLAHPIDCGRFLTCVGSNPVVQFCPMGLHWNEEENFCDYPRVANCSRDDAAGKANFNVDKISHSQQCLPQVEECPASTNSQEDVVFMKHSDCRKFYACASAHPIELNCPHDLFWNSESCICENDIDSECDENGVRRSASDTQEQEPEPEEGGDLEQGEATDQGKDKEVDHEGEEQVDQEQSEDVNRENETVDGQENEAESKNDLNEAVDQEEAVDEGEHQKQKDDVDPEKNENIDHEETANGDQEQAEEADVQQEEGKELNQEKDKEKEEETIQEQQVDANQENGDVLPKDEGHPESDIIPAAAVVVRRRRAVENAGAETGSSSSGSGSASNADSGSGSASNSGSPSNSGSSSGSGSSGSGSNPIQSGADAHTVSSIAVLLFAITMSVL